MVALAVFVIVTNECLTPAPAVQPVLVRLMTPRERLIERPLAGNVELDGILNGPSGRSAAVRTVWILFPEEQSPRFVTAFPR